MKSQVSRAKDRLRETIVERGASDSLAESTLTGLETWARRLRQRDG